MDEKDLLRLKEKIEQAKAKASELKGRQDYLMQELEQTWKCKSLPEARAKLATLDAEIADLDKQIKAGIAAVEQQING
jgi:hypothetical protein